VDGWTKDIYGTYRNGAWQFEFSRAQYPGGLDMKFVLNGTEWMAGFNLHLSSHQDHHVDENTVTFPDHAPRYRHAYDNLLTDDSPLGQEALRRNLDAGREYDATCTLVMSRSSHSFPQPTRR